MGIRRMYNFVLKADQIRVNHFVTIGLFGKPLFTFGVVELLFDWMLITGNIGENTESLSFFN